jgi:hypothetical protein
MCMLCGVIKSAERERNRLGAEVDKAAECSQGILCNLTHL